MAPYELGGADDGEEKPLELVVAKRALRAGRMVEEGLKSTGVGRGEHQVRAYCRQRSVSRGTRRDQLVGTRAFSSSNQGRARLKRFS